MRLVLCDDHMLLLDALVPALTRFGHCVLGVATSPEEAVDFVGQHRPDGLLLDVTFPDGSGLRILGEVAGVSPETKVVILSGTSDPAVVSAAVDAGAVGFARKDAGLDSIVRTLDRVMAGEIVIDPDFLRAIVGHQRNQEGSHDVGWLATFLTSREREVLARIVAGQTTDEMAGAMGVARSTARTHVQSVLQKLGVHSRLQAATAMFGKPGLETLPRPRKARPSTVGLHQMT